MACHTYVVLVLDIALCYKMNQIKAIKFSFDGSNWIPLAFVIFTINRSDCDGKCICLWPKMQFGNTMNWQPQVTMPRRLS